ncbi:MAG: ABC transporter ATP-binding protein/permease [Alphaproteobacteria bacterium]|nr:ABC transporter ATP-binding protein/permease [Alphaproteobacteria bacterium]
MGIPAASMVRANMSFMEKFLKIMKGDTEWMVLSRLLPYIWPSDRRDLRCWIIVALVMLILSKLATVLVPFFYKWAVDSITGVASLPGSKTDSQTVLLAFPVMMVIAYGLGRVFSVLFAQLRDGIFAKVSQHAVRTLALRSFEHLHHLSLSFHLGRHMGGLNRVIERGVKGIELIVRHAVLGLIPTILELLFLIFILLFYFSFLYMVTILLTMFFYLWFTFAVSEKRMEIRKAMNNFDSDANAKAVDSLLNFETVKYFSNEEWEAKRFDKSMQLYEEASIKTYISLAVLNFGQVMIFTTGMVLCMLFALFSVIEGTLTLGDFVMVNSLLVQFYIPLHFVGMIYRELKQGFVDIDSMFDLLSKQPEVTDSPRAKALVVTRGEICFKGVSFAYGPEQPGLRDISFTVPPGRKVAIVGPSGSGKTTLLRLLFRFYDVDEGQILIDGQNIADVTQDSLRAVLGIVPQDTVLFNDTIGYNVHYGCPGASEKEMQEAAHSAQIGDFVNSLASGYNSQVGERGLKLSGGEKQRIAIARTILKDPPILILDEATSALDTQTEHEIQAALSRISSNRTTIVIAHRLSTVIDAYNILVISDNGIVEQGSHEELLAKGGLYKDMWIKQLDTENRDNS